MIHLNVFAIGKLMALRDIPTQRALAKELGWDESRVSGVLRGRRSVGMRTVEQLCLVLGCQPGDILQIGDPCASS